MHVSDITFNWLTHWPISVLNIWKLTLRTTLPRLAVCVIFKLTFIVECFEAKFVPLIAWLASQLSATTCGSHSFNLAIDLSLALWCHTINTNLHTCNGLHRIRPPFQETTDVTIDKPPKYTITFGIGLVNKLSTSGLYACFWRSHWDKSTIQDKQIKSFCYVPIFSVFRLHTLPNLGIPSKNQLRQTFILHKPKHDVMYPLFIKRDGKPRQRVPD